MKNKSSKTLITHDKNNNLTGSKSLGGKEVPTSSSAFPGDSAYSSGRLTHAEQETENAESIRLHQVELDLHALEAEASRRLLHIHQRFSAELAGKKVAEAVAVEFSGGNNYGLKHSKGFDVFIKTRVAADDNLKANIQEWVDGVKKRIEEEIALDPAYWATQTLQSDDEIRESYFQFTGYREALAVYNATIRYAEDIYAKANGQELSNYW